MLGKSSKGLRAGGLQQIRQTEESFARLNSGYCQALKGLKWCQSPVWTAKNRLARALGLLKSVNIMSKHH